MKRLLTVLGLLFVLGAPAWAVNPSEMLADPALEARARSISEGLRCLVCQNESIDDSNADLAHDLRVLVRDRLKSGDTDEEVVQYIVDRYGEFVLLKPVFALHTLLLWGAAPAALIVGLIALIVAQRRRKPPEAEPVLSREERDALDALDGDDTPGPATR